MLGTRRGLLKSIPAWHKVVNVRADFDSVTDVGASMADAVAAAHDGDVGLEITFVDATVAFGDVNADAINQISGVKSFWFNPNSFGLENTKVMTVASFRDGANAEQWWLQIKNNGGTYQVRVLAKDDAAATKATSFYDLVDNWNKLLFMFNRSTGADDGWMMLFIGDVLQERKVGIDNDTKDWDYTRSGMIFTNSTAFGGSFYVDTIKIRSN